MPGAGAVHRIKLGVARQRKSRPLYSHEPTSTRQSPMSRLGQLLPRAGAAILEANYSNVMRNDRPMWLVDSSKTLYVAHTGKSLSLPESCP
jgi:hypothetical protein